MSSSYETPGARWEAYQFCDPFATFSFVCCNKKHGVACRPSCDALPKVATKEEIVLVDTVEEAMKLGFKPCTHCEPTQSGHLDLPLIKRTIEQINGSIGFNLSSNSSSSSSSSSKKRALSTPSLKCDAADFPDRQHTHHHLTRNESEHVKLVELACRHIACAAAENVVKQQRELEEKSTARPKKRRGGVLGFKELASKSKLSPWHFHRVFKSVTGLTPKAYGDQCWKLMRCQSSAEVHFRPNSDVTKSFSRPRKCKRAQDEGEQEEREEEESIAPTQKRRIAPQSHVRHHSLDLGSIEQYEDFFSSPQFSASSSLASVSDAMVLDIPRAPVQYQQDMTPPQFVPNDEVSPSTAPSLVDAASLSLYPGEEPVWAGASLDVSTPPQQQYANNKQESFYNVLLDNSPLETEGMFHMNDYPGYAPFEGLDSGIFTGEVDQAQLPNEPLSAGEQQSLFEGITMMQHDTMDLVV